jgi:hypothetical protein
MQSLFNFTYAAASRYAGAYARNDGTTLPAVGLWLAWDEPNNPARLMPQYTRVGGKSVMAAPAEYAKICATIYEAVHAAQQTAKVGCGATASGERATESPRQTIEPLSFLRAVRSAGLLRFDAWAHNPAAGGGGDLGGFRPLIAELTRLYGQRRVWITQYGFETSPPDRTVGVSWARQARFLRKAYLTARANPRVDLFTWYLLKDDPDLGRGSQSGLLTATGQAKPALAAVGRLPH